MFLREPVGLFFTVVFPLVLLAVFGTMFGKDPIPGLSGYHMVDSMVPAYMAMIIATIAFIGLPIELCSYRVQGVLKRYQATPLSPLAVLLAQVIVNLAITLAGSALLIAGARWFLNLTPPAEPLRLVPAVLLCVASLFSLGFVMGSVLPSPRTSQAVGMALFMPMLFLSGAAMPVEVMPRSLQTISQFSPLTHAVHLFQTLWIGGGWNMTDTVILCILLVSGAAVSACTFRWQ